MRPLGLLASLTLIVLIAACSNLRAATAHQIGCSEAEVRISDDSVGFESRTWKAYCNNQTYDCESLEGGSGSQVRCVPVGREMGPVPAQGLPAQPSDAQTQAPAPDEANAPPQAAAPSAAGCQYDTQCKGERICKGGQCVNPEDSTTAPHSEGGEGDDEPDSGR